jgi:hypothetical protein
VTFDVSSASEAPDEELAGSGVVVFVTFDVVGVRPVDVTGVPVEVTPAALVGVVAPED